MIGAQRPRICVIPQWSESLGQEAIDLAAAAGLLLDDWQQFVLLNSLGRRSDKKWAAPTVGLVVGRQNGKNAVLEARELAGLFLLKEETIIHSAHEQATSSEHFRRLLERIDGVDEFRKRILKVSRGKGSEALELRTGQRVLFKTRTGGGGRGFSVDLLVYDEAMILSAAAKAALVPTMAARSIGGNTQTWYSGSAVDQLNPKHDGLELSRIRAEAVKAAGNLAYFEWSAPGDHPAAVTESEASDESAWALANPGLGIRISSEWVEHERSLELGHREFCVERLGVGDWPNPDPDAASVLDLGKWRALEDARSQVLDPVALAYDITPDRSYGSVAVAGQRADGADHVELIAYERGTSWIVEEIERLCAEHDPICVVCDASGAAASLLPSFEAKGVVVEAKSAREHAAACGVFFDAVEQGTLRHLGQPELAAAVRGATQRPLGDAWAWNRKTSAVDISPLVAVTLALADFRFKSGQKPKAPPRVINLNDLDDFDDE